MDSGKKRCPNWTEKDKIILFQLIGEKEDELFGKFRGSGRDVRAKANAWEELTKQANAQLDVPRTVDQLKKQYDNLKSRAKQKIDDATKPKTGRGPKPPDPSTSMQLLIDRLGDKPNMTGIPAGIDTEEKAVEEETGIPSCTTTRTPTTAATTSPQPSTSTSSLSKDQSNVCSSGKPTTSAAYMSKQKKRKSSTTAEEDWAEWETKRARTEIAKLKKEKQLAEQRMEQEKELFEMKKSVLQAKLKYYNGKK